MVDTSNAKPPFENISLFHQACNAPVVMIILLACAIGASVVQWFPQFVHFFTIQDYIFDNSAITFNTISRTTDHQEYWRFVTPIFLHFGFFHLVFNALLFWVIGQKLEYLLGSLRLAGSIAFIAIISNIGQYLENGTSLFGGLSGVVYGLLGFIWISQKLSPVQVLLIPQGLFGFMMIWLVLGLSGAVSLFIEVSIANGAHFVGLISGIILGAFNGLSRSGHSL